jgi:fermentation-respiration switch protein FrsA (DUF1100 family)
MWWILLVPLVLYALVCAGVALEQGKLVWFPGPPPAGTPADHGLAYDELRLVAADGVAIHAWRVRNPTPARAVVIVCHGNAGNVESRIPLARAFLAMECDVVLFDYRGYGASSGAPTEEGTYLDAEAAWTWARSAGFAPERIVAYGESLGGAVAIELARRHPVAAVVVEDTFTSLRDMGARFYPWLPVGLVLRIRYDSIAKIGALGVPVMVVHSRGDDLVPFELGQRLFAAAQGPKRFLETEGGHNAGGFATRPAWCAEVRTFLLDALARPVAAAISAEPK